MDTPVIVGDILEAVGDIEMVKRTSSSSASSDSRDIVHQSENGHAKLNDGHLVNDQQKSKNVVTFMEDFKSIYTSDLTVGNRTSGGSKSIYSSELTSQNRTSGGSKSIYSSDIASRNRTSGDIESTSDFILKPRPMTTTAINDKPLVKYKYKTLSTSAGSRSSRGRNPHEKLESEYRELRTQLTKPKSTTEQPVVEIPSQTEDTPFNKYIASLWVGGRYNHKNGKVVNVKQFTMNFPLHTNESTLSYVKR